MSITLENNKKIIEIRNVSKTFKVGGKNKKVLIDVDFDVFEGEFLIITGPSGSGKSTILHAINGWLEPDKGDVMIKNKNIYLRDNKEKEEIVDKTLSMVQQTPGWIKSLNTLENISIPYAVRGQSRKVALARASEMTKLLDLEEFSHHKPVDLSGGQQQRVALLRSLMNNPEVIIADEPTGNLDMSSSVILMYLLKALNNKLSKTIVMSTHDYSLLKYATRVVYLKDGEIDRVEQNDPDFVSKEAKGDILDIQKVGWGGTE